LRDCQAFVLLWDLCYCQQRGCKPKLGHKVLIWEVALMAHDALIEEINEAYRRLGSAMEEQARADRELTEHVRMVRLDNAESILEARNERTASLYLDGLLDTEEHRLLVADRARADLDLQHARREIERLHLIVRLLGTQGVRGTRDEWDEQ
jgi:hypothetical protein